jgi:hypothetical protein
VSSLASGTLTSRSACINVVFQSVEAVDEPDDISEEAFRAGIANTRCWLVHSHVIDREVDTTESLWSTGVGGIVIKQIIC